MSDAPFPATPLAEQIDTQFRAALARRFASLSPSALLQAASDWTLHLAASPGKRMDLAHLAMRQAQELASYTLERMNAGRDRPTRHGVQPPAQDRRFAAPEWQQWPFNVIHQGFLLQQQWWHNATTGVRGVSRHHENMVTFAGRQWLDMWSPSNFIWTNPEVLDAIRASGGANLWRGAMNFLEDARRLALDDAPAGVEGFEVGKDVAVTPGKVVFRNHLIELIQYSPTTPDVHAEPVLIVPSWIMKYYILDLSPHNSMVKYLVDQGHTVFILSWKNPTAADRDLGLEDYRWLGVMDALDAVTAIVPERKVQAVGYCLGGTLLAIAAAAMARDGDERLQSLTLLASETDFRESGEIALFIDDSQLAWLEAGMWDKGYLDGKQMAGAFQMLNSRDLIWSRRVREYLLGERQTFNDLMAWNADATRMPALMHAQYLRRLFLNNDLAGGRYPVRGKPVVMADVRTPIFCVATYTDHVAPWRSVHKLHYLTQTEIHFVLTSGGHNAGIVSEPGRPRRRYQSLTRSAGGKYVSPDEWLQAAPQHEGSWWPEWVSWLQARSGEPAHPPRMGAASRGFKALCDAPGEYVMEK